MRPTGEFEMPVAPALPKVKRATVVTPQPGNLLVFEFPRLAACEYDEVLSTLREACPEGVAPLVIEGGRFAGVIRRGAAHASAVCGLEWLSGECPKRDGETAHECGRPACHDREHECAHCGHRDGPRMADASTLADVAAGRTIHIPAEPGARP